MTKLATNSESDHHVHDRALTLWVETTASRTLFSCPYHVCHNISAADIFVEGVVDSHMAKEESYVSMAGIAIRVGMSCIPAIDWAKWQSWYRVFYSTMERDSCKGD